jgi:hypothetical protein
MQAWPETANSAHCTRQLPLLLRLFLAGHERHGFIRIEPSTWTCGVERLVWEQRPARKGATIEGQTFFQRLFVAGAIAAWQSPLAYLVA